MGGAVLKTWMPGTRPGMTPKFVAYSLRDTTVLIRNHELAPRRGRELPCDTRGRQIELKRDRSVMAAEIGVPPIGCEPETHGRFRCAEAADLFERVGAIDGSKIIDVRGGAHIGAIRRNAHAPELIGLARRTLDDNGLAQSLSPRVEHVHDALPMRADKKSLSVRRDRDAFGAVRNR